MTVSMQVARLLEVFPRQRVTPETLAAYTRELSHLDAALLDRAVTVVIRTHETDWLPTVAQVLAAAAEEKLALPTESEALTQVQARHAMTRTGKIPDGPLHPLVRKSLNAVGGMLAFAQSDGGVVKGQFGRVYRDARAAAIRAAVLDNDG